MTLEPLPPEILQHYAEGREAARLDAGHGLLERARTEELLARHLPPPPATILDVGGGPGRYAAGLAEQRYEVHLIDAVALHVEQARQAAPALASARVADARALPFPDASVDAVLLLGPLYHLTERAERLAALRESRRVLRAGGPVLAVGITRFASLLDGLVSGYLGDPDYRRIVERDLLDGQHRNPTPRAYFTTAFFHHPDELADEVREAGLEIVETVGVEGPGWLLPDLGRRWADPTERAHLLWAARAIEREPSLLGLSPHVMVVARR
jgi:ubiquinone/menaquinone biosynthesis C-methylase UbiE